MRSHAALKFVLNCISSFWKCSFLSLQMHKWQSALPVILYSEGRWSGLNYLCISGFLFICRGFLYFSCGQDVWKSFTSSISKLWLPLMLESMASVHHLLLYLEFSWLIISKEGAAAVRNIWCSYSWVLYVLTFERGISSTNYLMCSSTSPCITSDFFWFRIVAGRWCWYQIWLLSGQKTVFVITGEPNHIKSKSVIRSNKFNVVSMDWVITCRNAGKILPVYVFFLLVW